MSLRKSALALVSLPALLLFLYLLGPRNEKTGVVSTATDQRKTESHQPVAANHISASPTIIPENSDSELMQEDKAKLGTIRAVFSAPISFYGKVIDQYGQPVTGANVHYAAADHYFGDSTKSEGISDENGFFSVTGLKGAGLFVNVAKDGYSGTDHSGASFGYGMPSGNKPPTRGNPAVFVLRKKGVTESLIHIDRDIVISMNGTPVEVSLQRGEAVPRGKGDISIECWSDQSNRERHANYDWHFRLLVPSGGLLERRDDTIFEAPVEGYQPGVEFSMSESDPKWRDSHDKNYFVQLGNGTYARMRFRITTGGAHFASVDCYLNPSGSRNLEPDPSKEIKP